MKIFLNSIVFHIYILFLNELYEGIELYKVLIY